MISLRYFLLSAGLLYLSVYIGPRRVCQYINWAATDPDFFTIPACVSYNCLGSLLSCVQDQDCKATMDCTTECQLSQPRNKQAMCAYICEVTDGYLNKEFEDVMLCMIEHKCMSNYPQDGTCVAREEDGVKSITDMNQIKGDWWVIKGLNCGESQEYPGGYDWFPCQHERWNFDPETAVWQNK